MLISFEINPLKSWNWVEKENANSYYYKKLGRTVNEQKQKKKTTPKVKSESTSIFNGVSFT